MARKKRLPVGIEDFKELVTDNYYFVDKTGFIADFLDTRGKVTLFTRPRRFGKTLTLSMLLYFFTMENAAENRKLFAGLNIEKRGEEYMAEQGTRPVIFLTLKEATANSFSETISSLTQVLWSTYSKFAYLLDSDKLAERDKAYFRQIYDGNPTRDVLKFALANLLKFLETHHGTKPILLLDEYDAPIIYAVQHNFYNECIDFMRGFLSAAFKTNPALDFAVLTGVTRVSKESIFSGLNNLKVCSVLSEQFSAFFGFTQEEVATLMNESNMPDKLPDLKEWYDGYLFGQTEIYNPWSIISFIDTGGELAAYWINVSQNAILKDMLARLGDERRELLFSLVKGNTVDMPLLEHTVLTELYESDLNLFTMLLTAGYLKVIKKWRDEQNETWGRLKIPNEEIRIAYRREIINNIVPRSGERILVTLLTAMTRGDDKTFAEKLSTVLRDFVSYHDTASESFYHGLLLGLSVWLNGKYNVESNAESGYGRFDIAFIPSANHNFPGIILELKIAKTEDELEHAAQNALEQIDEKKYTAKLTAQGVSVVWRYGVAFCGKKVWLVGE